MEPLEQHLQRMSVEENGIVDAVGRLRGVADMIETSSVADAKQKSRAKTLGAATTKTFRLHAQIIMTMQSATLASL